MAPRRKHFGRDAAGRLGRLARILEADGFTVTPPKGNSSTTAGSRDSKAEKKPRQSTVKEGDWHCTACGFHNFASRKVCRDCKATAPAPSQSRPASGGQPAPQSGEPKQGKFEEQLAALLDTNPTKKALLLEDLLGQLLVSPKPRKEVSKEERVRKAGAAAEEARIALNKAERAEENAQEALAAAKAATIAAKARKEEADKEIAAAAAMEELKEETAAMDHDGGATRHSPPPVPVEVQEVIAKLSGQELPKDAEELRTWLGSIAASLTSSVEKAILDTHAAAGRLATTVRTSKEEVKTGFSPY